MPLKRIPTRTLDEASLAYLQAIEAAEGTTSHGAFIRKSDSALSPRTQQWIVLTIGVALIGVTVVLSSPSVVEAQNLWALSIVQACLLAVGCGMTLWALAAFRQPLESPLLGRFYYADGSYLWDVSPDLVDALPLSGLERATGTHYHAEGNVYTHSTLVITIDGRIHLVTVKNRGNAELMLAFLNVLLATRHAEDEQVRLACQADPRVHAAFVVKVLTAPPDATDEYFRPTDLILGTVPPEPTEAIADEEESGPAPVPVPWGSAIAVLVAAILLFPWLNGYLLEDHYRTEALKARLGDNVAFDKYLARFPTGRYATELGEMRDDRRFQFASEQAKSAKTPRSLREYLADATNTRHRPEAQRQIAVYYDDAIKSLKDRATKAKGVDKTLFAGMLALLQSMKTAERPVVTVGFKSTQTPEPTEDEQKAVEKFAIQQYEKEYPELKQMAKNSPDGTAIMTRGQVFEAETTQRRERVILERLRAAFQQACNADVLTLEMAQPGEPLVLEVAYHAYAPGRMYVYTQTQAGPLGLIGGKRTVKGLLRGYEVSWKIALRPPGADKPFVYELESEPANSLNYDSRPSDPDWGPYAILLYSSFYDMSSRLIRSFALDPGPAPTGFSFDAVAGNGPLHDAGLPKPNPPFGLPKIPAIPMPKVPVIPQPKVPAIPKPLPPKLPPNPKATVPQPQPINPKPGGQPPR